MPDSINSEEPTYEYRVRHWKVDDSLEGYIDNRLVEMTFEYHCASTKFCEDVLEDMKKNGIEAVIERRSVGNWQEIKIQPK